MPNITLTASNAVAARIENALCARHGYVSGNKLDFVRSVLAKFVKSEVKAYEVHVAMQAAAIPADAAAETEIIIT